jgi:hypothetical protein
VSTAGDRVVEDASMPNGNGSLNKVARCIRACRDGDETCKAGCEATFKQEGGTVELVPEGGKVFIPQGGKVFISHGGKVF